MNQDIQIFNPSLRILFVSHAYAIGVNQGKLNAIAEIEGIEVGLLVPNNWQAKEWNRPIPVERPYKKIRIYAAPVQFTGRGGAHFFNPWQIWQVLSDFKPDLVQVEEEVFSLCAFEMAILTRLRNKPLIVFGWENIDRQLPYLRRLTCQFVLNTASAIIPGNFDGAKIMRSWGYTGTLEVMPQLGVDTNLFAPQLPSADEAKLIEANEREFKIGFLGRLVPEKGVDLILAAVRQLQNKGYNCRVVICGSGSSETELRQKAKKLQIAELITWRGAVRHEEAPIELSKFDVLVLPSRSIDSWKEQFGHVLIEAMAMGIPVIGSTCGEIPNVIQCNDLIFQEEDILGLTKILERMIRDLNWKQKMARHSINMVQKHYSHQRIAERLINLWHIVSQKNKLNLSQTEAVKFN